LDISIISTGGTFNKIYNPIKGELEIDKDSKAIEEILKKWNMKAKIINIIHKDSLFMNESDREELLKEVKTLPQKNIIIVHGTDTMDISAKKLALANLDKRVIFTGAMVPFSIDKVEATANLVSAITFCNSPYQKGVYIAMHSLIAPYNKIIKNREKGIFELI
jgi:L-asparaginase